MHLVNYNESMGTCFHVISNYKAKLGLIASQFYLVILVRELSGWGNVVEKLGLGSCFVDGVTNYFDCFRFASA